MNGDPPELPSLDLLRDFWNLRWNSSRRQLTTDNWTLNEPSAESDDKVSGLGGVGALCSGRLLGFTVCSQASPISTCSLFGLCCVGSVGGVASCMICRMSGTIVFIIPAKVCTCLARPRNASCETTEGPAAYPGGESPGLLNRR